jgi:hypothetical protein
VILAAIDFLALLSGSLTYSRTPCPYEYCNEGPLEGLASLESTTPSNIANLQKSKGLELSFVAHTCYKVKNR